MIGSFFFKLLIDFFFAVNVPTIRISEIGFHLQKNISGTRWSHGAAAALNNILDEELKSIHEAGTWKEERIITSKQAVNINVQGSASKLLNFCSNNYLGLSVGY